MFTENNAKVVKKYQNIIANAEAELQKIPASMLEVPVIGLNTLETKELAHIIWRNQDIIQALHELRTRILKNLGEQS